MAKVTPVPAPAAKSALPPALNDRQRQYLLAAYRLAVYRLDQQLEAAQER